MGLAVPSTGVSPLDAQRGTGTPSLWTSWLCWASQAPCCHWLFPYCPNCGRGLVIRMQCLNSAPSAAAIQVLIPAVAPLHLLFASSDKWHWTWCRFPLAWKYWRLKGPCPPPFTEVGITAPHIHLGATRFFSSG